MIRNTAYRVRRPRARNAPKPFARAMASYPPKALLSTSSSRNERRARRDRARQAVRLWHLGRCPAHDIAIGRGPVRRHAQYAPGLQESRRSAAADWWLTTLGRVLRRCPWTVANIGSFWSAITPWTKRTSHFPSQLPRWKLVKHARTRVECG